MWPEKRKVCFSERLQRSVEQVKPTRAQSSLTKLTHSDPFLHPSPSSCCHKITSFEAQPVPKEDKKEFKDKHVFSVSCSGLTTRETTLP